MGYVRVRDGSACAIARSDRRNVRLYVERGLVVTEATRSTFPPRSIFLDGVFLGPPFLDNARRQYALDHHQGVLRQFTLATCEQAAVIVALGLPLGTEPWSLYINEPDLDAVLAAWVLLHHDRIAARGNRMLSAPFATVRVEGNIDAHGFELPGLTGLPPRRYALERRRLDRLRRREIAARRDGTWDLIDWLAYTEELLFEVDRELFGHIRPSKPPPASARAESERRVAVLIASPLGIYETEVALRVRFGEALARVVLVRADGRFTLLQCDPFLSRTLEDVYPLLNAADAGVEPRSIHGWGGSPTIGGSPRKNPTVLSGREVLRLVAALDGLEPVVLEHGVPSTRVTPRVRRPRMPRRPAARSSNGHAK